MRTKDWYAVLQMFGPYYFDDPKSGTPTAQNFGVNIGVQTLVAVDYHSEYGLHVKAFAKTPGFLTASEVVCFIVEVLEKHGPPRKGVVIGESVWKSSEEMVLNEETRSRGEWLRNMEIEIPPMPRAEMDSIRTRLAAIGLKAVFDESAIHEV